MGRIISSIALNLVKYVLATIFGMFYMALLISTQTSENLYAILFESEQAGLIFEDALKNMATELPVVGILLGQIFSFQNAPTITFSTGFEEIFSFALMLVVVNGLVKPLYSYPAKAFRSSCEGIDVVVNTYVLAIISLWTVTGTLLIRNNILKFLQSFSMAVWLYNSVLLILTIVFIWGYYGIMKALHRAKAGFLSAILLDICIAMILLCFVSMLGTLLYVGLSGITKTDELLMCALVVILPIAGVYVLSLKEKYGF
mgnify:CR=1 FL=1